MLGRVVRVADGALEPEPVVLDGALCQAVVARDDGPRVPELGRHRLVLDGDVEVAELRLHVEEALCADGAPIRHLPVRVVARLVDAVAAAHEDD